MRTQLFVYGTLHPNRAPAVIADVVARFEELGRGRIRGHLYDLGDYPGAVLDPNGYGIPGIVFSIPEDILPRLDDYEGFDPTTPEDSLFLRVQTQVSMDDDSQELCWLYVWKQANDLNQ